jgi:small nuclear ribonucleoprotein (snRNP)-like protein
MELKHLASIMMRNVLVMTKDGSQISGKITSHRSLENNLNHIIEIKVCPSNGIPTPIQTDQIDNIEVVEEECICLDLVEI